MCHQGETLRRCSQCVLSGNACSTVVFELSFARTCHQGETPGRCIQRVLPILPMHFARNMLPNRDTQKLYSIDFANFTKNVHATVIFGINTPPRTDTQKVHSSILPISPKMPVSPSNFALSFARNNPLWQQTCPHSEIVSDSFFLFHPKCL